VKSQGRFQSTRPARSLSIAIFLSFGTVRLYVRRQVQRREVTAALLSIDFRYYHHHKRRPCPPEGTLLELRSGQSSGRWGISSQLAGLPPGLP
jgi:hypothetical protein